MYFLIEHFERQRQYIEWLIKLRAAAKLDKIKMLIEHCPCCSRRAQRNFFFFNDLQLSEELAKIKEKLDQLIDQININQIL